MALQQPRNAYTSWDFRRSFNRMSYAISWSMAFILYLRTRGRLGG